MLPIALFVNAIIPFPPATANIVTGCSPALPGITNLVNVVRHISDSGIQPYISQSFYNLNAIFASESILIVVSKDSEVSP